MSGPAVTRSLTLRLTLIYMGLFGGSIGLMLAVIYMAGVWLPLREVRASIERDSQALVAVYQRTGRDDLIRGLQRRARGAVANRAPYHVLLAPNGAVVAANLQDWPAVRSQEWLRYEFGTYATGAEEEHEAVVRDLNLAGGYRLIIGLDTEDLDEREDLILEALSWGVGMTLLLGVIGGLVTTLAVSRRLEAINRTAKAVIAGDLSGRIALRGRGDDFDQLAETLNRMLERNENLVLSLSRVSDSIAHELRTPLSRLRADLEDVASAETPEEMRGRSEAAIEEATRIQAMFESLLRLARLESGAGGTGVRVDLTQLLEDAAELHRPAAEDRSQSLEATVAPGLDLVGDRDLLFQMVSNLLGNAVKFAPVGGHVALTATRRRGGVEIVVADDGPGVPAEQREQVFERFYRAPDQAATPGFGLGLSLVAAAAKRHGGAVRLEDASPGLRVVVTVRSSREA